MTFQMTSGGLELLTALQTGGRDQRVLETVLKQLPHGTNRDTYLDWIKGFQSTPAMDDLVAENSRFITEAEARNSKALAAADRLRMMSFPMSIAGLLLSVFAFGHIVANKPPNRFTPVVEELTPEAHELVNRCLILVVALSVLDLIWTILASQANQMAEINPLGRVFIADPLTLAGFKLLMTGLGVTLLYALKRHRIPQTASWWACLILTLLTMRWLTFNSMFA